MHITKERIKEIFHENGALVFEDDIFKILDALEDVVREERSLTKEEEPYATNFFKQCDGAICILEDIYWAMY